MVENNLQQEAKRATTLLKGKIVTKCIRNKPNEIIITFSDGTRIFIDSKSNLELSITWTASEPRKTSREPN